MEMAKEALEPHIHWFAAVEKGELMVQNMSKMKAGPHY